MLELKGITKDYTMGTQIVRALKGVDLEVKKGDFLSIMGHSGSGKSTLMNIIGLLDVPTQGTYHIDGKEVANLSHDDHTYVRGRKIGFVFQTYNLIKRTPAIEQVMLPLQYQGYSDKECFNRAKSALERVGLGDKLNNKPNELSGGQQQRVSIARALVTDPAIILADEPTGALDSTTGYEIMDLLRELNKEGKTIVLITHEQEIADYAKTHIYIKDGLVIKK